MNFSGCYSGHILQAAGADFYQVKPELQQKYL